MNGWGECPTVGHSPRGWSAKREGDRVGTSLKRGLQVGGVKRSRVGARLKQCHGEQCEHCMVVVKRCDEVGDDATDGFGAILGEVSDDLGKGQGDHCLVGAVGVALGALGLGFSLGRLLSLFGFALFGFVDLGEHFKGVGALILDEDGASLGVASVGGLADLGASSLTCQFQCTERDTSLVGIEHGDACRAERQLGVNNGALRLDGFGNSQGGQIGRSRLDFNDFGNDWRFNSDRLGGVGTGFLGGGHFGLLGGGGGWFASEQVGESYGAVGGLHGGGSFGGG